MMPFRLLFVFAAALVSAHVVNAQNVSDESMTIQKIAMHGGKIEMDDKLPGRPVVSVSLAFTSITDAGLKDLIELKDLKSLDLGNTKITDAGLKELKTLKSLQRLQIHNTEITDVGLKELSDIKSLVAINISRTRITDVGLKELIQNQNLTELDLFKTKITEGGLKELKETLPKAKVIRMRCDQRIYSSFVFDVF